MYFVRVGLYLKIVRKQKNQKNFSQKKTQIKYRLPYLRLNKPKEGEIVSKIQFSIQLSIQY